MGQLLVRLVTVCGLGAAIFVAFRALALDASSTIIVTEKNTTSDDASINLVPQGIVSNHSSRPAAKGTASIPLPQKIRLPATCPKMVRPPNYNYAAFQNREYKKKFPALLYSLPQEPEYFQLLPLLQRLASGGAVRIMVLGGSATSGVDCRQDTPKGSLLSKSCAWPARLKQYLQSMNPDANVRVDNYGQGGSPTAVILAGVSLLIDREVDADIDLVILDSLVNDATSESKQWLSKEMGKGQVRGDISIDESVSIAYEQMIRTLKELLPAAAILSLTAACRKCIRTRLRHVKVAKHYRIPLLDYAALAARNQPQLWPHAASENHPTWQGHQMLADAIAIVLAKTWEAACSKSTLTVSKWYPQETLFPQFKLDMFKGCMEPLSTYSARSPHTEQPIVTSGNWTLYEDRPQKPGWITHDLQSTLRFHLRFGKQPRFVVTWLRSYRGLGTAKLSLNKRTIQLAGLWDDLSRKESQSHSVWFQADHSLNQFGRVGDAGLSGFSIPSNSTADLDITLLPSSSGGSPEANAKFKIISVLSC